MASRVDAKKLKQNTGGSGPGQFSDCRMLSDYVGEFAAALSGTSFNDRQQTPLACNIAVPMALEMLQSVRDNDSAVYIIGNGGSAAVASHIANDFCNTSRLRAKTLHDPALLTCFANDYGYENAYAMLIERMVKDEDLLIVISSSGQSGNMLNAVQAAREAGCRLMTLTGFEAGNPLRRLGDLNMWVESSIYGMVEISHLLFLHYLVDQFGSAAGGD